MEEVAFDLNLSSNGFQHWEERRVTIQNIRIPEHWGGGERRQNSGVREPIVWALSGILRSLGFN